MDGPAQAPLHRFVKGQECFYVNRDGYFLGRATIIQVVPPSCLGEDESYVISVLQGDGSTTEKNTVPERLRNGPEPPPPPPAQAPEGLARSLSEANRNDIRTASVDTIDADVDRLEANNVMILYNQAPLLPSMALPCQHLRLYLPAS